MAHVADLGSSQCEEGLRPGAEEPLRNLPGVSRELVSYLGDALGCREDDLLGDFRVARLFGRGLPECGGADRDDLPVPGRVACRRDCHPNR